MWSKRGQLGRGEGAGRPRMYFHPLCSTVQVGSNNGLISLGSVPEGAMDGVEAEFFCYTINKIMNADVKACYCGVI